MMQMLAGGGMQALTDGVRTPDDDNPRGYYEFEAVKRTRDDDSWLDDARGKVVKMVHRLLYDLPLDRSYRVILMRRNLREIVSSQATMLSRLGRRGADMSEEALCAAFERQLREIATWLDDRAAFQVLPVSYNDLLEDPAPIIASIDAFLGGGLDTDRMRSLIEPSLYRQRAS
jgi:hypothetical protein